MKFSRMHDVSDNYRDKLPSIDFSRRSARAASTNSPNAAARTSDPGAFFFESKKAAFLWSYNCTRVKPALTALLDPSIWTLQYASYISSRSSALSREIVATSTESRPAFFASRSRSEKAAHLLLAASRNATYDSARSLRLNFLISQRLPVTQPATPTSADRGRAAISPGITSSMLHSTSTTRLPRQGCPDQSRTRLDSRLNR